MQETWSGLPYPPPGDLPHPGIKPMFLVSPEMAGRFFTLALSLQHPKVRTQGGHPAPPVLQDAF